MSLDISVQHRTATSLIGVPVTARLSEFGAPEGPNDQVPRVYAWLADHEIPPLGGPLFVYRHIGPPAQPVDLTVGVPVGSPVETSAGLVNATLPAGAYIVATYTGPPDAIPAAQEEARKWAADHGHTLGASGWSGYAEHFLTNPEEELDPSRWTTELLLAID